MQHETLLRQVALISYGTKFLRKEIELDAWYRHGIFAGSRLRSFVQVRCANETRAKG